MGESLTRTPSTQTATSVGEKMLDVLSAAVVGARFADVVAQTGLPKATVHRILHQLVDLDFLVRDPSDRFAAGPAMLGLAGRTLNSLDVATVAHPVAVDLAREVDCTIHVGAESGEEVVYLVRQDASKPYRMRSRVGSSMAMHSSGMGKAILATWPRERVIEYAHSTGLPSRTVHTITDLDSLLAELDEISRTGYALDLGENEGGTVCVAVGIADTFGRVSYALSISTIELEYAGRTISELAPHARAAAAEIARRLGR